MHCFVEYFPVFLSTSSHVTLVDRWKPLFIPNRSISLLLFKYLLYDFFMGQNTTTLEGYLSISLGISAVLVAGRHQKDVLLRGFTYGTAYDNHCISHTVGCPHSLRPCTNALVHSFRRKAMLRSQRRTSRRPRDCTLKRLPFLGRCRYYVRNPGK